MHAWAGSDMDFMVHDGDWKTRKRKRGKLERFGRIIRFAMVHCLNTSYFALFSPKSFWFRLPSVKVVKNSWLYEHLMIIRTIKP